MDISTDPSSLSNVASVVSKHIALDVKVDFEASKLVGSVTLSMELLQEASEVWLDTVALSVTAAAVDGAAAGFSLDAADEHFGSRLRVALPEGKRAAGSQVQVRVEYSSSPSSSGLQWLPKEQTADQAHPFLFSQCQAIHARSMLPCQDAPGNKCPYSARVEVPGWATALLSATQQGAPTTTATGTKVFEYEQALPMPTYLIAIAVGLLESREISPRSRVWAEPSMIEAAHFEFSQAEEFVARGEKLLIPYEWGRYDVLLMPPSFPYGGMENPQITFVTNSLIAGDRSLADVLCHEVAHSWTGNLVTNKTWHSFFLNEGATMWVQRKVVSAMKEEAFGNGDGVYKKKYFEMDAYLGLKHLKDDINRYGLDNPLTCMVPNLDGIDPDDAFSRVPYEKGFTLLYYLETVVGTPAFEAYMKAYISNFRLDCVTAYQFRDFFMAHFASSSVDLSVIEWDRWFFEPGMPIVIPDYDTSLLVHSHQVADAWLATGAEGRTLEEVASWSTVQTLAFLDMLLAQTEESGTPLSDAVIRDMGALYGYNTSKNAEIRFRWQTLCLQAGHEEVFNDVVAMLKFTGRMKFFRPLTKSLAACGPRGRALAEATFEEMKNKVHPICSKMVRRDLAASAEAAEAAPAAPAASAASQAVVPAASSASSSSSSASASTALILGSVALAAVAVGAAVWLRRRRQ